MNLYGAEEFAHPGDCPGCQECETWKCEECGADDPACQDDDDLHLCNDCGPAQRRRREHENLHASRCRDPRCDVHGDPPDDDNGSREAVRT